MWCLTVMIFKNTTQSTPKHTFSTKKFKNFLGRGTLPPQTSPPVERGTLPPHTPLPSIVAFGHSTPCYFWTTRTWRYANSGYVIQPRSDTLLNRVLTVYYFQKTFPGAPSPDGEGAPDQLSKLTIWTTEAAYCRLVIYLSRYIRFSTRRM